MMLKRLRIQLTLLYLLAAAGLVFVIGAGSYYLLQRFTLNTTDLAMQYKMATLFDANAIPLPPELAKVRQIWLAQNPSHPSSGNINGPQNASNSTLGQSEDPQEIEGDSDDDDGRAASEQNLAGSVESEGGSEEDSYDARLAPIFVLPLNNQGGLISNPNPAPLPIAEDDGARSAAEAKGFDWRTFLLADGTRVRLLTYRTGSATGPAYFQVGRLLSDQDRMLAQFFTGLLLLGGFSIILLGVGSWWLSGRSLGPAQKAWEQQHAFVSNASHELRTPLTLIRATAEVGLRGRPGVEQQEILEDVVAETDYMNRLVDDLLMLSRLDSHRLELSRQAVSLPNLLAEVQRQMDKVAAEKGVEISHGEVQGSAWADPLRLRQVLLILLDNALRYTPQGGGIRLETKPAGKTQQIRVTDTGIGIPEKDLPHVFERFYQGSRPGISETRSNGLGLSIAKGLVEAQGGTIQVESQEGKGTCVILSMKTAS